VSAPAVHEWTEWPSDLLAIIPCSKGKLDVEAPARDLYTGPMFRMALRAAQALTDDANIRVLSARHGFIDLDRVLSPYDVAFRAARDSFDLTWDQRRRQAVELGIADRQTVISLCPNRYDARVRDIWPNAIHVFEGCRGVGDQRGRLSAIIRAFEP
jgi:hypothetical protein